VRQEKERAYNRLASVVRASLDMEKLAEIMGERP
jgi:adenosylcobyric acid synthase